MAKGPLMPFPVNRGTLTDITYEYWIALSKFDEFVNKLSVAGLDWLQIAHRGERDKTHFKFELLGSQYLIRHRFGPNDEGFSTSVIECLLFDDTQEKYLFKKKCFVAKDGRVFFDRGPRFEPGIPANSEFILYEFLSGTIPVMDKFA
jgi:hypothetical protein